MSLAMICPTRGRPAAVGEMAVAWVNTDGPKDADLWWIVDADDPELDLYRREISQFPWMKVASIPQWMPMVPKLNWAARQLATQYTNVGFLGDDHMPRSVGWAAVLAAVLDFGEVGIVYGRDGFQDKALPTWWAMTSNIVTKVGRMVPADVQHLYCDNAIYQLGAKADCLAYLEDVLIEHMHPIAGKGKLDEGYRRVNRKQQYTRDRAAFEGWVADGMMRDASLVGELRGV